MITTGDDELIRNAIGAAGIIRCIEFQQKSPITREQFLAFRDSYTGNFSADVLDEGMVYIMGLRKTRGNLFQRVLASLKQEKNIDSKIRSIVENTAKKMLAAPAMKKTIEDLINSDFGRKKQEVAKNEPYVISLAMENRRQRRGIHHPADLMATFILSLDTLFHEANGLGKVERSDATLFDLGCYLLFRIDLYLFKEHRDLRDEISKELSDLFVHLFDNVFDSDTLEDKYDQRIDLYDDLIKITADTTSYHNRIEQMMLLGTRNGTPQDYFINTPLEFTDALAQHPFKLALLDWEKNELLKCLNNTKSHLAIFLPNR